MSVKRCVFRSLLVFFVSIAILSSRATSAQPVQSGQAVSPSARASAPIDLTGYWTALITEDWHVRMLGPAGAVYNITELRAGSTILGFTTARARHVGMAIDEYCLEQ